MIGFRGLHISELRWVALAIAVAALGGCALQGAGSGTAPQRNVEQDIDVTRNTGPTSTDPGAPRDERRFLLRSDADRTEERRPPSSAAQGAATHPQTEIAAIPAGDRQTGRRFALDNCRPCHVVAPDQGSTVRFANAPDFHAIANGLHATQFELNVWLTNPHPTMPSLTLSPQEAQNVIAYILSLRDMR